MMNKRTASADPPREAVASAAALESSASPRRRPRRHPSSSSGSPPQGHRPDVERKQVYARRWPPPLSRSSLGRLRSRRGRWNSVVAASLAAVTCLLLFSVLLRHLVASRGLLNPQLARASQSRCSSLPQNHQENRVSKSRVVLVASHLRGGPDGRLRLRIIEHNLRRLGGNSSGGEEGPPIRATLVFSVDHNSFASNDAARGAIDEWRSRLAPSVAAMIDNGDVLFVPNDSVMVDASKWVAALQENGGRLIEEVHGENSRVMLINDSFVLWRPVPELWGDGGGGGGASAAGASPSWSSSSTPCSPSSDVCGLAWTAPLTDPTRHVQSYVRTLSPCAVDKYVAFYEEKRGEVSNVNELIVLFEINLEWTRRRRGGWWGGGGDAAGGGNEVAALYEYAGAHPDADLAQKILIPWGYPAIKLKKFFVTDDPWLLEPESTRSRLPPSFSSRVYKRMNHDLNHLSDEDAERHFAENGKDEDRIYSTLPLVIKGWLRDDLARAEEAAGVGGGGGGKVGSTIAILEDFLEALNRAIAEL
ncbi:hypothetical protein ACHAWF_005384 [Thalassiosira exigua]